MLRDSTAEFVVRPFDDQMDAFFADMSDLEGEPDLAAEEVVVETAEEVVVETAEEVAAAEGVEPTAEEVVPPTAEEVVQPTAEARSPTTDELGGGGGGGDGDGGGGDGGGGGAGYPGGPSITTLLTDYDTHKAREIWVGSPDADLVLTVHRHDGWVRSFRDLRGTVARPWYALAQQSGLTGLTDFRWDGIDFALITAFVERWHADTNTFVFPWGDIGPCLHDASILLGLPLEGMACRRSPDVDLGDVTDSVFGWTGADEIGDLVSSRRIKTIMALLSLEFFLDDEAEGVERAGDIATGALAILLGATLFINRSNDRFDQNLLALLVDHDQTAAYSWSSGCLAYLFRSLGQGARQFTRQIGGCTFLLQVRFNI